MYYFLLLMLIVFSIIEIRKGDKKGILFHIAFVVLTLVLCLRYGQGTDYFGYMSNYNAIDMHSETGFVLFTVLCKICGLSFEWFVAIIALIQMGCLYRAIQLYSPVKTVSLLLFFPTLYLTYSFSGMRQGIVILFFIGFMIKWLQNGKWIKYLIACAVLFSVHSAALILFPLVLIKWIKTKWLYWGVGMAAAVGCFIFFAPAEWFDFIEIGAVEYYINSVNVSVLGLAERVVMFGVLTYLVWLANKENPNENINFMYKIYVCGFLVSIMFFPWSMLCSRMAAMMKATEILLFPMLLREQIKWKKLVMTFLIVYAMVMTVKNIWTYMGQSGGDYKGYNFITYPYLTVFEKERVHEVRSGAYGTYLDYIERYETGILTEKLQNSSRTVFKLIYSLAGEEAWKN